MPHPLLIGQQNRLLEVIAAGDAGTGMVKTTPCVALLRGVSLRGQGE